MKALFVVSLFTGSMAAQAGSVTIHPGQSYQAPGVTVSCQDAPQAWHCLESEWVSAGGYYYLHEFKGEGDSEALAREALYGNCLEDLSKSGMEGATCPLARRKAQCYRK